MRGWSVNFEFLITLGSNYRSMITNSVGKLPQHDTKRWATRDVADIDKVIVHQACSNGTLYNIAEYHTEPNHISDTGCPSLCYHYAIETTGEIHRTAKHSDLVWHCAGQNTTSVGVLVIGDFAGEGYLGSSEPTYYQLASLRYLLNKLIYDLDLELLDIYGHSDYGKPACPGYVIEEFIAWLYHTGGKAEIYGSAGDIL